MIHLHGFHRLGGREAAYEGQTGAGQGKPVATLFC